VANRKLIVEIIGDSSSLERAFGRSAKGAKAFGTSLIGINQGVKASTVALAGGVGSLSAFGLASLNASAHYGDAMQRIVGLSGVAQDSVNQFSDEVLNLSRSVGRGPQELAEALFFITSSGIDAAHAMDVLKVSAEASAAGLGQTQVVADAITSAMNAYGPAVVDATRATDVLVATVREGKGEAADFAGVIGNVTAFASQLGVSFEDVGAALAAMTRLGTDAETSAIQLQQVFSALVKVSPASEKAFRSVGLSSAALRKELRERGLLATLQTLKTAFGGNEVAMAGAFREIRALRGVFSLIGNQAQTTAGIFDRMSHSAGSLETAFGAVKEDDLNRWRRFSATVDTLKIKLGGALSKPLTEAADDALHLLNVLEKLAAVRIPVIKIPFTTVKVPGQKEGTTLGDIFEKSLFIGPEAVQSIIDIIQGSGDKVGDAGSKAFAKEIQKIRDKFGAARLGPPAPGANQTPFMKEIERIRKQYQVAIPPGVFIGQSGIFGADTRKITTKLVEQRNKVFDAMIGRQRDRVQDVPSLQGQVAALTRIGSLLQQRLDKTKDATRRLNLEQQILENSRAVQAARQDIQDAFLDRLGFRLTKAEATAGLKDDVAALATINAELAKRIEAEKDVNRKLQLEQQLFDNQQKLRQKRQQQADAAQFRQLGLGPTGDKLIPTVPRLQKELGTIENLVSGTFLDTTKTQSVFRQIANVLSAGVDNVSGNVRQAIQQMLSDIDRQLRDHQSGHQTRARVVDTDRILSGLGLSPDQIREAKAKLAHLTVTPPPTVTRQGRALPAGAVVAGGDTLVQVFVGGKQVEAVVTRQQQTRARRNPPRRRGGHR